MLIDPRKYLAQHITDRPLKFEIGRDTGLVQLVIEAGGGQSDGTGQVYFPVRVILTPEAARSLLADLPSLASVLALGSKGPTKPDFVQ